MCDYALQWTFDFVYQLQSWYTTPNNDETTVQLTQYMVCVWFSVMFSLIAVLLKLCLNNCLFSRLPETRDDSDSTDSEEELDSPRKIVSQPNEKMDVDNSESKTHVNDLKKCTCILLPLQGVESVLSFERNLSLK